MSTLLFLFLGTKVDVWLGSKPVFTLIGAFVGAGAGFYYMYRQLVPRKGNGTGKGSKRDDQD